MIMKHSYSSDSRNATVPSKLSPFAKRHLSLLKRSGDK